MDTPLDKTIYIVSGFMRTGTSMMMKALEAGGLTAAYSDDRDKLKDLYTDKYYNPNEGGLYELDRADYMTMDFPNQFHGKLIKVLQKGVPHMQVTQGAHVIFMRRDQEEIRQSFLAFFNTSLQSPLFDEQFQLRMDNILAQIKNRKDVLSCTELWYRDVITDPAAAFGQLKAVGWDIDINKAAAVVKPELLRYKREELTEGVL